MTKGTSGRFLSWRYLAVLAAPLIGALTVSQLALTGNSGSPGPGWSLSGSNLLTPLFVTASVLLLLFLSLRRHGEKVARVIVSGIIVGGTLSGLVALRVFSDPVRPSLAPFYLLTGPIGFLGVYWAYKYYSGTLSARRMAWVTTGTATVLGGLLGTILPLTFTLVLLTALSLLDIILVDTDLVRRTLSRKDYKFTISAATVQFGDLEVGLGDILAYSILASSSLYNLGFYTAIATASLITLGIASTIRLARSSLKVAGLPLPLWLGILPNVVGLLI